MYDDPRMVFKKSDNSILNSFDASLTAADLKQLVSQIDSNNDGNITRQEIYDLFQSNKAILASPLLEALSVSHSKLDHLTNHPLEFKDGPYDYY